VIRRSRRPEEALELLTGLLDRSRRAFGEDDMIYCLVLDGLTHAERECGLLEDANRHAEESLAWIRRNRAESYSEFAAVGNRALGFMQSGEYAKAEKLFLEDVELAKKILGPRNAMVGARLSQYAHCLAPQGRYDEAIAAHVRGQEIIREAGVMTPEALRVNDLCIDLLRLLRHIQREETEEANRTCDRICAEYDEVLRQERQEVANHRITLGDALTRLGRLDDAEAQYRSALATYEKLFGTASQGVYLAKSRLADVLMVKEDDEAAIGVHSELLDLERTVFPPGDPRIGNRLARLGYLILRGKDYAEAAPLLRECLDIREKTMPDHWLRWNAASLLGGALSGLGRYEEAEPLLIEGYEQMEPPTDVPTAVTRKAEALARIVALYEAWEKPEEAARWRAKSEASPKQE
jgi:tetratricopeptide (TPR) repeat protein